MNSSEAPFRATPGDILLTSNDGWLSRTIRKMAEVHDKEPSRYSHAGLCLGGNLIMEALVGRGIVVSPIDTYKGNIEIWHRQDLPRGGIEDHLGYDVVKAALAMQGLRYSYWSLLLHMSDSLLRCAGVDGRPLSRLITPWRGVCSEFVARAWHKADPHQQFSGYVRRATPDDIGDEIHLGGWDLDFSRRSA